MKTHENHSYGRNADGSIMWQVQVLRFIAKLLRIQFKIGGQPYGAGYFTAINHAPMRDGPKHGLSLGSAMAERQKVKP